LLDASDTSDRRLGAVGSVWLV